MTPDDTQKGTLDALHRALFDSSPDMILLVQSNGEIHSRNEAAEGLGPARRLEDCFEAPDEIRKIQDRGFVASGEQELRLKDGRLVLLSVGALELYGRSAFQCILRDVTSYRLLAEELQLSRRMAAVGNLAAGVAHAMNNPLAVIMGRVELLQALGDGNKKDRERHLEVMADYARRMADIVQSLQIFSQPGLGSREEVAVQDVLKAAARACRERMGSVQIGIHVHPPGMVVPGDPVLLEQVFDGLLSWLANQAGRRAEISMVARSTGGNVGRPGGGETSLRRPLVAVHGRLRMRWGGGLDLEWPWGRPFCESMAGRCTCPKWERSVACTGWCCPWPPGRLSPGTGTALSVRGRF